METHTDHLARAADGLRLLAKPGERPWLEVARTAAELPLNVYRAVQEYQLWEELPPVDQVALAVAVVDGHSIHDLARYGPTDGHQLAHLTAECAAIAQWCDASDRTWPQADPERPQQLHQAVDHLTAYRALTPPWRARVFDSLTPQYESTQRLTRALLSATPTAMPTLDCPKLPEALAEAVEHTADEAPQSTEISRDLVERLARMPEEWQVHVMRRLEDQVTPLHAISAALQARNIAANRFSITDWTTTTSGTTAP
ncbi:hypothetical protein [Streptomyces pseudovenezuelae]|uniref:hypothetical protein n=1 Tax=Streptomyces pseudovenezuelae TaxID=67350 RepID=UPI0036E713ED